MSVSASNSREFSAWIGDRIDLDEIVEWIKYALRPGEVFDESELEDWARDHGFREAPDA